MIAQYDNYIAASYALFLDNALLQRGQGYINLPLNFTYKNSRVSINGQPTYYYSCPYTQLVCDASVTGAAIISGVHINNQFYPKQSGYLVDINYPRGGVYLTGVVSSSVTGYGAIKEFNIEISSQAENKIFFNRSAFVNRLNGFVASTGNYTDEINYPVIFLHNHYSENRPASFGGLVFTETTIRGIVLADTEYRLATVESVVRDSVNAPVPIITHEDELYNAVGGLKSGVSFNYDNIVASKLAANKAAFIHAARPQRFLGNLELPPYVYIGHFEVVLSRLRYPKSLI